MSRRGRLRALFLGLSTTLVVSFCLFLQLQPNRSGASEQHERPSTKWAERESAETYPNQRDMDKLQFDNGFYVNLSESVSRSVVQLNDSMLSSALAQGRAEEMLLNVSHLHNLPNTSKTLQDIQNDNIFLLNGTNSELLVYNVTLKKTTVHLVIACCLTGEENDKKQLALTKTFLKSLFTFNRDNIHLHVYVLPSYNQPVVNLVSSFKSEMFNFDINYYNASMPDIQIMVKDGPIWTKNVTFTTLFKPCSAQRLFLPYTLPNLDKVLYMDTDTLVLGPLNPVWNSFNSFNATQLYGMAFIARHRGFYDARPYRQPYKGKTGHNAGVMLMDLSRMRRIDWYNITLDIIRNLSGPHWAYAGDQDVFNYYNGLHPGEVFEMSCAYNWRWSYCRPYNRLPQECEEAHLDGITIVHGVSGTFFKRSYFPMRLYKIFAKYDVNKSINEFLVEPIKDALRKYSDYICGKAGDIYYKQMLQYIQ